MKGGNQSSSDRDGRIRVVFVALLIGLSPLAVVDVVDAQAGSVIDFEDQRTDGHFVYLHKTALTYGGWMEVWNAAGDVLWTNRGSAELPYLEPGETYSGWLEIVPSLERNQTLTAVGINDTNQNRAYDEEIDETILRRDAWMTVQIRSDFDEGAEGWTFVKSTNPSVSDSLREPQAPGHHGTGGVSGGYIAASDDLNGHLWDAEGKGLREWVAPWIYTGDRENFYDGTLSFWARGTVDWESCTVGTPWEDKPTLEYRIVFYSGDIELIYEFKNPDYAEAAFNSVWRSAAPGVEWERYTVEFAAPSNQSERNHGTENGHWTYYVPAEHMSYTEKLTEENFRSVFSQIDRIEIRAESVGSLSGTDCADSADTDESHLDQIVWNVGSPDMNTDAEVPTTAVAISGSDGEPTDSSDMDESAELNTEAAENEGDMTATNTESPGFTAAIAVIALTGIAFWSTRRR